MRADELFITCNIIVVPCRKTIDVVRADELFITCNIIVPCRRTIDVVRADELESVAHSLF